MIPGMGGLNPKKMQAIMKQMGISQEEIPCQKVIIEKNDGSKLVIEDPSVTRIKMNGEESFQVVGSAKTITEKFSKEDVHTVMEKTGCTIDRATKALEEAEGDLAEAILNLN